MVVNTNGELLLFSGGGSINSNWHSIYGLIMRLDRVVRWRGVRCQGCYNLCYLLKNVFYRASQDWALTQDFLVLQLNFSYYL